MIQIFEVLEVREDPYFLTVEVEEGELVADVINNMNSRKVYLLVDHDSKRIWTYNGQYSSFKLQIFGGILAGMLRKQIGIFYRIFPLNKYSMDDPEFQKVMVKTIGPGRAKTIEKKDFSKTAAQRALGNISIHNPRLSKALENINSYSTPEEFNRIFLIIAGTIYSDEETPKSFLSEEEDSDSIVKMGRLNNGFTFFDDRNYSTRVIVKNRSIQGIELFVHENDKMPVVQIKSPIIHEEKISNEGDMGKLLAAFQIPDSLPDIESTENEKQN
ncbi:MAG: hypothetical protein HWN79_13230 [Candidatus Lokiarchaeota archaeon]|nr:hypothetical protein [Candidatus Lokiarchaeota archaeon]